MSGVERVRCHRAWLPVARGPDRRGGAPLLPDCMSDHAVRDRPRFNPHAVDRLALSAHEHQKRIPPAMGLLLAARRADLDTAHCNRHRSRGVPMADRASPRSLSADRVLQTDAAGAGGGARLEVAVHLSRPAYRDGERAGRASRATGASHPYQRDGNAVPAHAPSCWADLCDGRHEDPTQFRRRSTGRLLG